MATDRLEFTQEDIEVLKMFAAFLRSPAGASAGAGGASTGGGRVASMSEITARFGDPTVRKDPKRWAGASYVGTTYSRCPSDYLETLADLLDWKADQECQKPEPKRHPNGKAFYWEYDRKDAALARGWAKRNEGRAFPPPNQSSGSGADDYAEPADTSGGGDDDIPF